MYLRRLITAACACLLPGIALAQTSYMAPDGKNRYPGVTIFCPNGTRVTPCVFGGGSSGSISSVTITSGGVAVSSSNRLPVSDTALDALISGGALNVTGSMSLTGTPTVALGSGSLVSLSVGGSAVSSSNRLPVSDTVLDGLVSGGALAVGGTVSLSGTPSVTQSGSWSVGLAAGSNAIGSVSISNLPATQAVTVASLPLPSGAATAAQQAAPLAPVAPAAATATSSVVIGCLSNTTLPSFAAGQEGAVPCDSSGRPYVVTVPSNNNVPSYLQAVSSGGATIYRAINTAASTMATNIKTSSGTVYGYEACNAGTSAAYFRIFAQSTVPVPGTSVPVISKLLAAGTCQTYSSTVGLATFNGIGFDVTSGSMADSDSTAVATANQITVEIYYK
jgi:hypothetical protein